jgi:uncharacterized HAD superfamily protein
MKFKSITDLRNDIIEHVIPKLPSSIGEVYGIPRSGMLPASIIATVLGVPLGSAPHPAQIGNRKSHFITTPKPTKLLVDDSIYGGGAMAGAVKNMGDVTTCAIYASERAFDKVDIYGTHLEGPRMFEWNFMGIKATEEFMFDMDGVLCYDPTAFDDDGPGYEHDIKTVKPKRLPQTKISTICTNRIERWREVTETWLKQHGVQYDKLIMQPFTTAQERRDTSNPGEYKAKHFNESSCKVFVESHTHQAKTIAGLTNKPVLSIEDMAII